MFLESWEIMSVLDAEGSNEEDGEEPSYTFRLPSLCSHRLFPALPFRVPK